MKPEALELVELGGRYPATRFSALIDHPEPAGWLSRAAEARGSRVDAYVDLDVGMGRTGVCGREFQRLYVQAAELPGLRVAGIHAYDGHVHESDPQERRRIADRIYAEVMQTKGALERGGQDVPGVVLGGTPAFPFYAERPEVELSPGTFVLHDEGYASAFPDLPFEPAAVVLARVVSLPAAGRVTVNAGIKAVSTDQPGGCGRVLGLPVARSVMINEEHWVLELEPGAGAEIGREVLIIPKHVCTTVNLYAWAHVVDGSGRLAGLWEIAARGHAPAQVPSGGKRKDEA